jgi:heme-degrading monooxygenase HmoA
VAVVMIVRVWGARASAADVPAYRAHLEGKVLPVLQELDGYKGAKLLTRADGREVELVVVTWWASLDAVRAFAGADVEHAVVDPEVRPLLSAWDDRVKHYEIAFRDEP